MAQSLWRCDPAGPKLSYGGRPRAAVRRLRDAWRMTVQFVGPAWPRVRPGQQAAPLAGGQCPAVQRIAPDAVLERAQSFDAALLLVIDGQLDLSSYRGRERLDRGMIAIRPTFDCRTLRAGPGGATWLQLPWCPDQSLGGTYRMPDADRILLLAGHDPAAALAEVQAVKIRMSALPPLRLHWIDDLHGALLADPHLSISDWARDHRVSREGAARAFRAAYSVSPARFRLELRARRAWTRIVSGGEPLSLIALEAGFADQSHMTRAVGWFTGRPPSAWRRKR